MNDRIDLSISVQCPHCDKLTAHDVPLMVVDGKATIWPTDIYGTYRCRTCCQPYQIKLNTYAPGGNLTVEKISKTARVSKSA